MQDSRPLRAVVITLGGERRALMEEQFAAVGGFEADFIDGVHSRSLRRKDDLRRHLEEAELVAPGDEALHASMWLRCRSLNRDRAVLGCYLAHLRAMRRAVDTGADVVFEDNVRLPASPGEAARRIRACAEASPGADLRLFGFGARAEDMRALYASASSSAAALPLPFRVDAEAEGQGGPPSRRTPAAWGAYAYWVSPRGWATLLGRIRDDMPMAVVAERGKSLRGYVVRALDKILPSRSVSQEREREEAGGGGGEPARVVAAAPVAYRAPMLRSTIHDKWDAPFCESTEAQMAACRAWAADSFDALWLSEAEREAVRVRGEEGVWRHNDGLVRQAWHNEKRQAA